MNFEGISLKKNFWRFVWPSVVAQWIFALYTMVDGMFVARGVSESALAAVNIVSPFVNFLFSVSILFAVGTSTIVAIYLGQGKHLEATQANTQHLIVSAAVSLLITVVMWLGVNPAVRFLGATEATMEYARHYILSILPFAWCFILSYTFETLVKTDGYPRFATIVVSLGAVINCILDYLFVMVFHWGVAGAGVATGISQMIPVFLYLKHFLGPKAVIRFAKPRWDFGQLGRVVKIGLSSGLTELSAGITVLMFNHAILRYIGEQGVVSYTIIAYVNMIVVMSMAGISQGIQPLISFYYGKQDHKVCKKLLRYSLAATVGLAGAAFLACMGGAQLLVNVFISKELTGLRVYSASVFRIFSVSFLIVGFNVVGSGYFTAVERPKESLVISLGRGVVILFAALAGCIALFGGEGIWWAPTVSEAACLGITLLLVRRMAGREERERTEGGIPAGPAGPEAGSTGGTTERTLPD